MTDDFNNYRNAVNLWDFERFNSSNNYVEVIGSWRNNEINKLDKYPVEFTGVLEDYVFLLGELAINIFELFSASFRIEENKTAINTFNVRYSRIQAGFSSLQIFTTTISEKMKMGKKEDASFLKEILHLLFGDMIILLLNLGIRVNYSPLQKDFKKNEKELFRYKIKKTDKIFPAIQNKVNRVEKPSEQESHPEFNPNLWNQNAYELFKYLFDNYYKGKKKRELTNIWFFLNEYEPQNYVLKATKDEYKFFIKTGYNIDLKNFDKAIDKYQFKEFPTMNDHRRNFEDLNN